MATQVVPNIAIQEVYSGGVFSGVLPDGVHSGESINRGMVQIWRGGSDGGEFASPLVTGMRVLQVHWNMDCAVAPNIEILLVDMDGVEYLLHSALASLSGSYFHDDGGILIPPGFSLRLKGSEAIDAAVPVVGEDTGVTGDGVSTEYSLQLLNENILKGSVSIDAGLVNFTDPAYDGVLVGVGGSGGSGTVDYATGAIEITLVDPTDFNASNASALYAYNKSGRVVVVIDSAGWGQPTFSQIPSLGRVNFPPGPERAP